MAKPHKMPDDPQQSSPLNKKKHKNNDPAKLHSKSTPTAQQTRKILMSDGVDCSIWMPFTQFMAKYLGVNEQGLEFPEKEAKAVRDAFIKVLGLTRGADGRMVKKSGSITEKEWSKAWKTISEDKRLPIDLCPGFILNLSEDEHDSDDTTKLRVDGSLISEVDGARMKGGQSNWSLQRLPIEFKRGGAAYDPFDDNPKRKHESDAVDRRSVYGQLMSYAQRVFVHQHRKHLFFLFVNGPEFRVMFFDHGGVITTEAIDYVASFEGTAALLSFLHAFNQLDIGRQGIDTTVTLLPPTSCGYKRMDELKKAHPRDFAHQARYVDDTSTIPESLLDSSDHAEAVVATDYGDPAHPCQGGRCHHKYPDVLPDFTYVRDAFRKSLKDDAPRYMVKVGDRRYLIGNCLNDPPTSLVGRGTKGYVALEWETQCFVFLKDTWRAYYVDIKSEGDILHDLNEKGVPNVPTVIAHGDVEEQETETTNYSPITGEKTVEVCKPYVQSVQEKKRAELRARTKVGGMKPNPKSKLVPGPNATKGASGGKKRTASERISEENCQQGQGLRHLIHYRLVVKEVCLPLTEITSSKQLVSIILHGIVAHETALKECKLVHRDISFGNMLIRPLVNRVNAGQRGEPKYRVVWQGLLADWELAKDWTISRALQPERTGTWHFMSWYTLTYADQPVSIPDELESFVHVLIYAAVRLVNHNISDIRGFINYYFDGYVIIDDGYGCPAGKPFCIMQAKLSYTGSRTEIRFCGQDKSFDGHPLNDLVRDLLALIRTRYLVLEAQEDSPDYDKLQAKSDSSSDSDEPSQLPSRPPTPLLLDSPSGVDFDTQEVTPMDVQDRAADRKVARQASGDDSTQAGLTPKIIAMAKSLETHTSLREILQKYLKSGDFTWPRNDIVPDRLKKYTQRPRESLSDIELEDATPKKARTEPRVKPAAASSSKARGRKTTGRLPTRQKTLSKESLSGQDDHGTAGVSSSRPTASGSRSTSGGGLMTRSASRLQNSNPGGLDAPQAGPSNPPGGSSRGPAGSTRQLNPKVYSRKRRRGGH